MSRKVTYREALTYIDNLEGGNSGDAWAIQRGKFKHYPAGVQQALVDAFITTLKETAQARDETRTEWREKYGEDEQ
jgi:hypothetical protein